MKSRLLAADLAFTPLRSLPLRLRLLRTWDEGKHPRGETTPGTNPGSFAPAAGGEAPTPPTPLPKTPKDINPNQKVKLDTLYGRAQDKFTRETSDLGRGVYFKHGGVSDAYAYATPSLYPEDVVYLFTDKGGQSSLVSGNGIEIWRGQHDVQDIERVLSAQKGIKAVIGTPDSAAPDVVSLRDWSIVTPIGDQTPATTAAPAAGGKKKSKISDFPAEGVQVDQNTAHDKEKADKLIEDWDYHVGKTPGEFKEMFLGDVEASMTVGYDDYENAIEMRGKIYDEDGVREIGQYTRSINFEENTATSEYFQLKAGETSHDIGKKLLAANVATYQKLGLDRVNVHANIDVGGYAWAKYGYVPTQESWNKLSSDLAYKIDEMRGGTFQAGTPESWDDLSTEQQRQIFNSWKDITHDEFYNMALDDWRDSGGPLADAKTKLADGFNPFDAKSSQWLVDGAKTYGMTIGEGDNIKSKDVEKLLSDKGTTLQNVLENTGIKFEDRRGDGNEDPEITIDDTKTPQLTDDERSQLEEIFVEVFNKHAEKIADDADPPDSIADSVADLQGERFSDIRDRDKFRWAEERGLLPEPEEPEEPEDDELAVLSELAQSDDPKSIWAIADSPKGKDLLLDTDWQGELDLHDNETMTRFNAYVAKRKGGSQAVAKSMVMPMRESDRARELFYLEHGKRADKDLHEPILADGDDEAAKEASRAVMRRAGIAPERIDKLLSKKYDPSQPRDPHGKWTSGGTVEGWHPGTKAFNDPVAVDKAKKDWIEHSPIKTIDDAIAAAPVTQQRLGDVGRAIASDLGVKFIDPGPKTKTEKGIERVKEKMATRDGNVARVTDIARATFLIDHPHQADVIANHLDDNFEIIAEAWRTLPSNYTDRAILVRDRNGMIGEVLIMDPTMAAMKEIVHPLYEEQRALPPNDPKIDALNDAMKVKFGRVLNAYPAEWKAVLGSSGKSLPNTLTKSSGERGDTVIDTSP